MAHIITSKDLADMVQDKKDKKLFTLKVDGKPCKFTVDSAVTVGDVLVRKSEDLVVHRSATDFAHKFYL